MKATQVYTVKNKIEYQIGSVDSSIQPYQAIVYTKSDAGNFDVPINPKAPLRSDFIPNKGYLFDINQVINNCYLYDDDALPSNKEAFIRRVKGMIFPFQVQTKTYVANAETMISPTMYVLNGLLKNRLFIEDYHNFLNKTFEAKKGYISTAPKEKLTDINATEYLYFLLNYDTVPDTIQLHCLAIFEDEDEEPEGFTLSEISGLKSYDVLMFNVSPKDVISCINSLKPIREYYISIAIGTVLISEARNYILDYQTQEQTYNLLFRNQLGVFETARFTAERDEFVEFSIDSFESNKQTIDYHSESITKLNLRTGYLQRYWLRYLIEELTASKEIYWLSGKQQIRLAHTGKNLKIYDPKTIQESATFEFKIAQTDIHQ